MEICPALRVHSYWMFEIKCSPTTLFSYSKIPATYFLEFLVGTEAFRKVYRKMDTPPSDHNLNEYPSSLFRNRGATHA